MFIMSKAVKFLNYMKANFKLVLFLTAMVITVGVCLLSFNGISAYVSESATLFRVLSIEALFSIYTYIISFLYSPYTSKPRVLTMKEEERRKQEEILKDLYQEPEHDVPGADSIDDDDRI